MSELTKAPKAPASTPDVNTPAGLVQVLKLAQDGDKKMLSVVRNMLSRKTDEGSRLAITYGDMYGINRNALVKYTSKDPLTQAMLERRIDDVRDELAGPAATPLERILCERVALCWFEVNEMDRRFVDSAGKSFRDAAHEQDRRDRAHRRFLAACRTLATVRRLAVPALQINVAQRQVNVAASSMDG